MKKMKNLFWTMATKQVEGVGVIEVILILVIIIGLVLIFRNQIGDIIAEAFASINGDVSGIATEIEIN